MIGLGHSSASGPRRQGRQPLQTNPFEHQRRPKRHCADLETANDPAADPNPTDRLDLKIEYLPPETLRMDRRVLRKNPDSQRKKLKQSIQRFGFIQPALIDENDSVWSAPRWFWPPAN
jgi:hypothetical protein